MTALYNDIEPYAAKLLRLRIADGYLPAGQVSTLDIRTLCQRALNRFNHVHLFAGIGGFALGARLAGVPDALKLFTAGFPCQPFSNAGRRAGANDNRYLWPETFAAFKRHKPDVAIFENVAGLASMAFPMSRTLVDYEMRDGKTAVYHYVGEKHGVLARICHDIETAGYDVQPFIIPAVSVDAKHKRDRIWLVALPRHWSRRHQRAFEKRQNAPRKWATHSGSAMRPSCHPTYVANTDSHRQSQPQRAVRKERRRFGNGCQERIFNAHTHGLRSAQQKSQYARAEKPDRSCANRLASGAALANTARRRRGKGHFNYQSPRPIKSGEKFTPRRNTNVSDTDREGRQRGERFRAHQSQNCKRATRAYGATSKLYSCVRERCIWPVEPAICRVVNGLPGRVDRIKALGNSVVSQVVRELLIWVLAALNIKPEWHDMEIAA